MANHDRADKICPKVTAPYFYKLERNGKASHILGTRHVSVNLAKMPAAVQRTLAAAKLVVLETPPDEQPEAEDPPGPSLASQLGDATWKHFGELVGADVANAIDHAKPSTAAAGLMMIYEDPSEGVDTDIEHYAGDHKIPIQGLESNEFQAKLLDKMLDLRMLKTAVEQTRNRAELAADMKQDLSTFCTGSDKGPGMDAKMKAQMKAGGYSDAEITDFDEQLLYARNRDWIPKLDTILAPGDVFVAVGADHLRGPRGVLTLLQAKGFTVTRVAP
jgi:uncharacterized protein YbaP (TraB family)